MPSDDIVNSHGDLLSLCGIITSSSFAHN